MPAPGVLELDVLVEDASWTAALPGVEDHCRSAAEAAFGGAWRSRRPAEASLVLADDARVTELNRAYRGVDAPTNVLSFAQTVGPETICHEEAGISDHEAYDGRPPVVLGDMIIAYETTKMEARRDGKNFSPTI